jgi:ATP-dependent RNA helicase DDX55/SPB4
VVATPGRIYDLIEKSALTFRKLEVFVMDEADKLLEHGNEIKLETILMQLPKQRRTGLFSATMPSEVKNLIKTGMRNPYVVEVKTESHGIFSKKDDASQSVRIIQFDNLSKNEMDTQIQNISEIP